MDNDKVIFNEVIKLGAIPDNMIYWSKPQGLLKWAEDNAVKSWELEVDFD